MWPGFNRTPRSAGNNSRGGRQNIGWNNTNRGSFNNRNNSQQWNSGYWENDWRGNWTNFSRDQGNNSGPSRRGIGGGGRRPYRGRGRGAPTYFDLNSNRNLRPPSPLPGSEEYRQRSINHTSALIQEQLFNSKDQLHDHETGLLPEISVPQCNNASDAGNLSEGVPNVFLPKSSEEQAPARDRIIRKPRLKHQLDNSGNLNASEIRERIDKHISNLSQTKITNIINRGGSSYDNVIAKIQKEKRLELSRALRDLCSSGLDLDPNGDVLADIIPDLGIKLEDLPREVIEELQNALNDDLFSLNEQQPIRPLEEPSIFSDPTFLQTTSELGQDSDDGELSSRESESYHGQFPSSDSFFRQHNDSINHCETASSDFVIPNLNLPPPNFCTQTSFPNNVPAPMFVPQPTYSSNINSPIEEISTTDVLSYCLDDVYDVEDSLSNDGQDLKPNVSVDDIPMPPIGYETKQTVNIAAKSEIKSEKTGPKNKINILNQTIITDNQVTNVDFTKNFPQETSMPVTKKTNAFVLKQTTKVLRQNVFQNAKSSISPISEPSTELSVTEKTVKQKPFPLRSTLNDNAPLPHISPEKSIIYRVTKDLGNDNIAVEAESAKMKKAAKDKESVKCEVPVREKKRISDISRPTKPQLKLDNAVGVAVERNKQLRSSSSPQILDALTTIKPNSADLKPTTSRKKEPVTKDSMEANSILKNVYLCQPHKKVEQNESAKHNVSEDRKPLSAKIEDIFNIPPQVSDRADFKTSISLKKVPKDYSLDANSMPTNVSVRQSQKSIDQQNVSKHTVSENRRIQLTKTEQIYNSPIDCNKDEKMSRKNEMTERNLAYETNIVQPLIGKISNKKTLIRSVDSSLQTKIKPGKVLTYQNTQKPTKQKKSTIDQLFKGEEKHAFFSETQNEKTIDPYIDKEITNDLLNITNKKKKVLINDSTYRHISERNVREDIKLLTIEIPNTVDVDDSYNLFVDNVSGAASECNNNPDNLSPVAQRMDLGAMNCFNPHPATIDETEINSLKNPSPPNSTIGSSSIPSLDSKLNSMSEFKTNDSFLDKSEFKRSKLKPDSNYKRANAKPTQRIKLRRHRDSNVPSENKSATASTTTAAESNPANVSQSDLQRSSWKTCGERKLMPEHQRSIYDAEEEILDYEETVTYREPSVPDSLSAASPITTPILTVTEPKVVLQIEAVEETNNEPLRKDAIPTESLILVTPKVESRNVDTTEVSKERVEADSTSTCKSTVNTPTVDLPETESGIELKSEVIHNVSPDGIDETLKDSDISINTNQVSKVVQEPIHANTQTEQPPQPTLNIPEIESPKIKAEYAKQSSGSSSEAKIDNVSSLMGSKVDSKEKSTRKDTPTSMKHHTNTSTSSRTKSSTSKHSSDSKHGSSTHRRHSEQKKCHNKNVQTVEVSRANASSQVEHKTTSQCTQVVLSVRTVAVQTISTDDSVPSVIPPQMTDMLSVTDITKTNIFGKLCAVNAEIERLLKLKDIMYAKALDIQSGSNLNKDVCDGNKDSLVDPNASERKPGNNLNTDVRECGKSLSLDSTKFKPVRNSSKSSLIDSTKLNTTKEISSKVDLQLGSHSSTAVCDSGNSSLLDSTKSNSTIETKFLKFDLKPESNINKDSGSAKLYKVDLQTDSHLNMNSSVVDSTKCNSTIEKKFFKIDLKPISTRNKDSDSGKSSIVDSRNTSENEIKVSNANIKPAKRKRTNVDVSLIESNVATLGASEGLLKPRAEKPKPIKQKASLSFAISTIETTGKLVPKRTSANKTPKEKKKLQNDIEVPDKSVLPVPAIDVSESSSRLPNISNMETSNTSTSNDPALTVESSAPTINMKSINVDEKLETPNQIINDPCKWKETSTRDVGTTRQNRKRGRVSKPDSLVPLIDNNNQVVTTHESAPKSSASKRTIQEEHANVPAGLADFVLSGQLVQQPNVEEPSQTVRPTRRKRKNPALNSELQVKRYSTRQQLQELDEGRVGEDERIDMTVTGNESQLPNEFSEPAFASLTDFGSEVSVPETYPVDIMESTVIISETCHNDEEIVSQVVDCNATLQISSVESSKNPSPSIINLDISSNDPVTNNNSQIHNIEVLANDGTDPVSKNDNNLREEKHPNCAPTVRRKIRTKRGRTKHAQPLEYPKLLENSPETLDINEVTSLMTEAVAVEQSIMNDNAELQVESIPIQEHINETIVLSDSEVEQCSNVSESMTHVASMEKTSDIEKENAATAVALPVRRRISKKSGVRKSKKAVVESELRLEQPPAFDNEVELPGIELNLTYQGQVSDEVIVESMIVDSPEKILDKPKTDTILESIDRVIALAREKSSDSEKKIENVDIITRSQYCQVALKRYSINGLQNKFKQYLKGNSSDDAAESASKVADNADDGANREEETTPANTGSDIDSTVRSSPSPEFDFADFTGNIAVIKVIMHYLIAGSDNGRLYVFNSEQGSLLENIIIGKKAVTCIGALVRSPLLYIGTLDRGLFEFNYEEQKITNCIEFSVGIQCMELKWDYNFIGSVSGSVHRLNTKTNVIEDIVDVSSTPVLAVRATMEGARKVLLVASKNQAVTVRDAMSGLLLRTMDCTLNPTVYTLLCSLSMVYCGTSKHDTLVFNFQDGQLVHKLEESNRCGVSNMTKYKNLLFTACYNGNIYVYKLPTHEFTGTISGPPGILVGMDVFNDRVYVSSLKGALRSLPIPQDILQVVTD